MNILFLSWNYPPALGGIEYVVENLFKGLKKAGHEVSLLTANAPDWPEEDGVFRAPRPGLPAYVWFALTFGGRLCRQKRPDVILCGTVVPMPAAVLLSWIFRVPVVVLAHGSDILHPGAIYQFVVRRLFRRAARICSNSAQTQRFLEEAGMRPDRIRVVYPGVRVEEFETEPDHGAEELIEQLEGRKVILTVGRLIRRKGVLEFVQHVMPEVSKACPEAMFLVVGDDAKKSLVHAERMKDRIQAEVDRLGLGNHVRLLGTLSQEDLVRLFFRADLFVLPCLDIPGDVEGFGIVFSEAAMAGTPSLATKVGGIPEAIDDGNTGVLVPPGDFPALVRESIRLLDDPALRKQLADRGALRARKEFAWDVIVQQYLDVCTSACER